MKKAVLGLSGGLDSLVVLRLLLDRGLEVVGVRFIYESAAESVERYVVRDIVRHFDIHLAEPRIFDLFGSLNAVHTGNSPSGYYDDPGMVVNVVPARNFVFAAALTSIACNYKASHVALGIHSRPGSVFPDISPEFAQATNQAMIIGTDGEVSLLTPIIEWTKAEIVECAMNRALPVYLTYSCYTGRRPSCGRCGACVQRLEAFADVGIIDPIDYEDREFYKTVT